MQCAFSPPRSQPQFPHAPVGCVCLVSVLGSWPLAATLLADVDHPESQEVFGQKLGAHLQFARGAESVAEFAPFPSPLPPASSGGGPALHWLALLWNCSVPLFCKRLAVCSGRLIFSVSLAIPQFKLLSYVSSHRLPSGHSGPFLTLSDATPAPFCSAPACWWWMRASGGTFLLGVAFRHVICGFYLFFLPVRLPSQIQKLPPDLTV